MKETLAVVNGPNLNWLGRREPKIYGRESWEEIQQELEKWSERREVELVFFQSNHEGELLDYLQEISSRVSGMVLNPAAFAHTSIALRDCVAMLPVPVAEVHLTAVQKREPFRRRSHTAEAAAACFSGFGPRGYFLALEWLVYYGGLRRPLQRQSRWSLPLSPASRARVHSQRGRL